MEPPPRVFSKSDVAAHTQPNDCWIILEGLVYDVSSLILSEQHPNLSRAVWSAAGTDATQPLLHVDPTHTFRALFSPLRIGVLARPSSSTRRKGFSQLEWMRIQQATQPPVPRSIPMSEVRAHASVDDAWMVVHGKVYNVTAYIPFHPGGVEEILRGVGKDGTSLFTRYHAWVNYAFMLERFFLGPVVPYA